jgi:hypothetical protein
MSGRVGRMVEQPAGWGQLGMDASSAIFILAQQAAAAAKKLPMSPTANQSCNNTGLSQHAPVSPEVGAPSNVPPMSGESSRAQLACVKVQALPGRLLPRGRES